MLAYRIHVSMHAATWCNPTLWVWLWRGGLSTLVAGDAGRSAVPVGELMRPSLQGGGAIPAGAARWVLLGQGQRGVCVEHMSCIQQVWLSLRVFIIDTACNTLPTVRKSICVTTSNGEAESAEPRLTHTGALFRRPTGHRLPNVCVVGWGGGGVRGAGRRCCC